MREAEKSPTPKPLADEYGNVHALTEELARGGQGVVFRTRDADLAIKQPLDAGGAPDRNADLQSRFQRLRLLPLPPRLPLALPLALLRDEPGYVMRLLGGMKPFSVFELAGEARRELEEQQATLPAWLAGISDKEMARRLCYYARTGSTHRRLLALAKCAAILGRLHSAGLVYGDLSPNNAFTGEDAAGEVWLIDADNLRFELPGGGATALTPGYGAPEIVRGLDSARPRTDCWAFAVLAFKTLALCHPFIGKKVLEAEEDETGWDAEPAAEAGPADLDEQAYAGYFPFVDDEEDVANRSAGGLPRVLVTTPALRLLFQETFGAGRLEPHRRPAMPFWAMELARAADLSLACGACQMSYLAGEHRQCPYCVAPRSAFLRARTPRWEMVISRAAECALPHRLFHPFSLAHHDEPAYEAVPDFAAGTAFPVRGTAAFPAELKFEFVEAES